MSGEWTQERRARAAITAACEPAAADLVELVGQMGAEQVWEALRRGASDSAWSRRAAALDLSALLAEALRWGMRFVIPGDDEWPGGLDDLRQARVGGFGGEPVGLWVRGSGRLATALAGSVAIVGARASTSYGDDVATGLAYDLGRAGRPVVSGGAYGIDAHAHRGALAAHGPTVAVLACGLDRPYPSGNQGLFEAILAEGVLVSEFPPGRTPTKRAFLARNRLIAATSTATVIVEAAARSGARNTIAWAHACNRPALAVPGPVGSAMSVTPHRLIRDGEATLVVDADDILSIVQPLSQGPALPTGGNARLLDAVPEHLMAVREVLPGRGAVTVAEIATASGEPVPRCLAALAQLEDLGLAAMTPDGTWRLSRPAEVRPDASS
ncbi:MAG TPA: DNA-processing protein DprA [Propionibacteriaceae bacterium]|nr:DNA-processing protein DprA [Propionibacteriaceae bacterium]